MTPIVLMALLIAYAVGVVFHVVVLLRGSGWTRVYWPRNGVIFAGTLVLLWPLYWLCCIGFGAAVLLFGWRR